MTLSLLLVTKAERYAQPFLAAADDLAYDLGAQLVLACDGEDAIARLGTFMATDAAVLVRSQGYLESVLDQAIEACTGDYILRIDDDERCSPAMVRWLRDERYLAADHWKFSRAHLWRDTGHLILSNQLWPDLQTRLSMAAKAGGRRSIHAGSPFGGGELAPVILEHHKFLVKTKHEREAIARAYDRVATGAGTGGMLPFSLPEAAYDELTLAPIGDGTLRSWAPDELHVLKVAA